MLLITREIWGILKMLGMLELNSNRLWKAGYGTLEAQCHSTPTEVGSTVGSATHRIRSSEIVGMPLGCVLCHG